MNIMMCINARSIGGVETHVLTLSEELNVRGHQVVIVSSSRVLEKLCLKKDIIHYTLPIYITLDRSNLRNIPNYLLSVLKLYKIAKHERIDIIHSHGPSSSAIIALIASNLLKKPIVYTNHVTSIKGMHFIIFKILCNRYDAIITISRESKDYIKNNFSNIKRNIYVVYNGINIKKYSNVKLDYDRYGTKRIIHISRMDKEKIYATSKIIESIKNLSKEIPIELTIIGGGECLAAISGIIEKINKNLPEPIIFLKGELNPDEIPIYLQKSDLVIGAGRVAIEGMASGKPVIFASPGGLGGILDEDNWERMKYYNFSGRGGKTNYCSKDIEKLIKLLLYNSMSYNRAKDIGNRIIQSLDINNVVTEIERIYLDLIHPEE